MYEKAANASAAPWSRWGTRSARNARGEIWLAKSLPQLGQPNMRCVPPELLGAPERYQRSGGSGHSPRRDKVHFSADRSGL